jgi:hypothetical protein
MDPLLYRLHGGGGGGGGGGGDDDDYDDDKDYDHIWGGGARSWYTFVFS